MFVRATCQHPWRVLVGGGWGLPMSSYIVINFYYAVEIANSTAKHANSNTVRLSVIFIQRLFKAGSDYHSFNRKTKTSKMLMRLIYRDLSLCIQEKTTGRLEPNINLQCMRGEKVIKAGCFQPVGLQETKGFRWYTAAQDSNRHR